MLASTFAAGWRGWEAFCQRLLVLPAAMALLWLPYGGQTTTYDAHGFYTRNGLILNILGLAYASGILTTVSLCKRDHSPIFQNIVVVLLRHFISCIRPQFPPGVGASPTINATGCTPERPCCSPTTPFQCPLVRLPPHSPLLLCFH